MSSVMTQDERAHALCNRYAPHGLEADDLAVLDGRLVATLPESQVALEDDGGVIIELINRRLAAKLSPDNERLIVQARREFEPDDWSALIEALAAVGYDADIEPNVLRPAKNGMRAFDSAEAAR